MATQEERFQAMRKQTETKIRMVAVRLFVAKGYGKTTMNDIAVSAGVSTGLAYRYFKSKQELFNKILLESLEGIENVIAFLEHEKDPKVAIVKMTDSMLTGLKNNDDVANLQVLVIQSIFSDNAAEIVEDILQIDNRFVDILAKVIKKGQAVGDFVNGDPEELAYYYLSSYQGIGIIKLIHGEKFVFPSDEMFLSFLLKKGTNDEK